MNRLSKRYKGLLTRVDAGKEYDVDGAVACLLQLRSAKFNETVELSVKLGIDTKKTQQPVRGSVVLPHGTGRKIRILVFTQGEAIAKAQAAGADHVGGQDLVEKVKGGWMEFDAVIATPDVMKMVAPLGKVLGPRGLMPSPKTGTVTFDVDKIIAELQKGRIDFKMDKDANVQFSVGKAGFEAEQLRDNITAAVTAVANAKPPSAKGVFIKNVTLSLTMSPAVRLNTAGMLQQSKTTA